MILKRLFLKKHSRAKIDSVPTPGRLTCHLPTSKPPTADGLEYDGMMHSRAMGSF